MAQRIPVASVVVAPDTVTLIPGAKRQLDATTKDSAGTVLSGRAIVWISSDTSIATVANGLATGIRGGTAIMTATSEGRSGVATITVRVPVAAVSVTPDTVRLKPGAQQTLQAVALDSIGGTLAGRPMSWSSTDTTIARVSTVGVVTAVADGLARIVAATEGKSDTASVRVFTPVYSVGVAPAAPTIFLGASRSFTAAPADSAGKPLAGRAIRWASTDSVVVTVDSAGLVKALNFGRATISATSEGKTGSAVVTVTAVPTAVVDLPAGPLVFRIGALSTIAAQAKDSTGAVLAGRTFTWTSSDTTIATVDGAGTVFTKALGTTSIAAATEGKTDSTIVQVSAVPVASVSLSPDTLTLEVGASADVTATTADSSAFLLEGRAITFTTTNAAVATVSVAGRVASVSVGTATIRATSEGKFSETFVKVTPLAPVAKITVRPTTLSVAADDTAQVTVTLTDSTGRELKGRQITGAVTSTTANLAYWHPGDMAVHAALAGSGTLSLTSEGKSVAVPLTVKPPQPIQSVRFHRNQLTVEQNIGSGIRFYVYDISGRSLTLRQASVSVNDTSMLTLDPIRRGDPYVYVFGKKLGTALVKVQVEGFSDTLRVDIIPTKVTYADISPNPADVQIGATVQLTASFRDFVQRPILGRPQTWMSADTTIASVSTTGLVTGRKLGNVYITANTDGWTPGSLVNVVAVGVFSVTATPNPVRLSVGGTKTIAVVARNQAGDSLAGRSFVFTSSATGVATVSSTGLVTGKTVGSTTITVTSEGKSATVPVTVLGPGPVATITLAPTTISVKATRTDSIKATLRDSTGAEVTGRTITWTTSAPAIATVNTVGLVTGVAPGSATISATSETKTATVAVSVTTAPPAVSSVDVVPAGAALAIGAKLQLTVRVIDVTGTVDADRVVAWTSANAAIATVSSGGLLTGIAAGSTTVTANSEGKTKTITVTVTNGTGPVNTVTVTPSSTNVGFNGGTVQLSVALRDVGGALLAGRAITWTTSNPAVATVSSAGVVTGVAAGSATITATSEGKAGTSSITSAPPAVVARIAVGAVRGAVLVGDTLRFVAAAYDASGNVIDNAVISWTTAGPPFATVSAAGLVTGVTPGIATIVALSGGKEGIADVKVVTEYTYAAIEVRAGRFPATFMVDSTADAMAIVTTTEGDMLSYGAAVSWTSSNPAIVTAVPGPKVYDFPSAVLTGKGVGSAIVTATMGGKSDTLHVTVHAKPTVVGLEISPDGAYMIPATTKQLAARVYDSRGSDLMDRAVAWTTSNAAVAGVSTAGLVTANAIGSADITATSEGRVDRVTIRVVQSFAPVATVTVTPGSSTIPVGGTQQHTATMRDGSGVILTGREAYWSISDSRIATISSRGLVTGKSGGTVTVSASSEGKVGTATVRVTSTTSGGGSTGGGSTGGSGGSCYYIVNMGGLSKSTSTGWIPTPFPGLDIKVGVGSQNTGGSASPKYQYKLYANNRYQEKAEFSYGYRVGSKPTSSFGATSVAAGAAEYVDYFYGPLNTSVYIWVGSLKVGGRSQCP